MKINYKESELCSKIGTEILLGHIPQNFRYHVIPPGLHTFAKFINICSVSDEALDKLN